MKNPIIPILILLAMPAYAESTRQLHSHEHGVGELNIAVDGGTVAMEFHAPGADIVGFEFAAKSESDHAAIDQAVTVLSRPLHLFVMPPAADCSVVDAAAGLEAGAGHGDDHGKEHDDDHDPDHNHSGGHDDNHTTGHVNTQEGNESHAEFHAKYKLFCGNIKSLSHITFAYFEMFRNAVEIDVQIVTGSRASAFEVERDNPKLELTGLF